MIPVWLLDIENRTWRPARMWGESEFSPSTMLIHAATYRDANRHAAPVFAANGWEVPKRLPLGSVVGICNVTDICDKTVFTNTPAGPCDCGGWAFAGHFHWPLTDVRPLTPISITGTLGLWRPPAWLLGVVAVQLTQNVPAR